ncbi:helix-turn-helix domain-containing protein [Altibacter sp.]|uniref:helix-turn-helix domain-containing protein n=1 Tax=Altibacter sp. TaxID=2024823 RepID=UPI000C968041|nr:helix-turn-helix domain-containing protein [Altibacter sp.]MAP54611.1 hypothetical protein [Altibacter sp.]|tara:strand:+ start:66 stop:728 length:663 start_codon:yes stop_codon:yes gene_type:complete
MDNSKDYNKEFKGIWIPKEYLNYKLKDSEILVLSVICGLDNENGCYAKNKKIAEMVNKSEGRISKIIASLETKKLITCEYDYRNNNPRTIFINSHSHKRPTPIVKNDNSHSHKRPTPIVIDDQYKNSKEYNKGNNKSERALTHFDFLNRNYPSQVVELKQKYKLPQDQWRFFIDYFNQKKLNKSNMTITTFEKVLSNWKSNLKKDIEGDNLPQPYLRKIS